MCCHVVWKKRVQLITALSGFCAFFVATTKHFQSWKLISSMPSARVSNFSNAPPCRTRTSSCPVSAAKQRNHQLQKMTVLYWHRLTRKNVLHVPTGRGKNLSTSRKASACNYSQRLHGAWPSPFSGIMLQHIQRLKNTIPFLINSELFPAGRKFEFESCT